MSTIKSSSENLILDADGANNDIIFQSNGTTKATLDQAGLLTTAAVNVTGTVDNTISGTLVVKGGLSANQTSALTLFQQNSTHSTIKAFGANGSTTGVLNIYCAASDGSPDTLVTSVTANGLTFNGDTAAANALDDYEQGTWTAAFEGATFSGGNRTGYYTKVGNLVHASIYVGGVTISNVTAAGKMTGIPYNMANLSNYYEVGGYVHGNAATGIQNFYLDYSNNKMYPTATDATSSVNWVAGSSKHLMVSVTYRTA